MSICNRNRIVTGVRFLLRVTLRRLDLAADIHHLREPEKIALVMSPDETIAEFFARDAGSRGFAEISSQT